jgi:serine/threonine protein kinase
VLGLGSVVNGKYRLSRLLGDGGMGSVYEAQHAVLGTRVAIKVLHPDLARRGGLVERFLQEARVAAQIRNPHVVQVTDVDRTSDGQAYIVMELLEGEALSSVLERQPKLPIMTACDYMLQVLSALDAAHALGVIHRDLKPENVFLTFAAGKPVMKLIDFGIAKARRLDQEQKSLTVAGVVMGTAEYMAPEQARSADKVDARADLYAAGVILYEMIAGCRPVSGDDARVIALKVEQGDVVPLVRAAPEVPRDIAGLVHRAMAARPELRFASATEMRLALEKARRQGTAAPGGDDRRGATAAQPAAWEKHSTLGMQPGPAHPPNAREQQVTPAVQTIRAPPIATALAPAAYAGAAVPLASPGGDAKPRGHGRIVAMVALPVLLGASVVALLVGTGTWALNTTRSEVPIDPRGTFETKVPETPGAAPLQPPPVSDVPKLVPTIPLPLAPHLAPSGRPSATAAADAAAAPPPSPFFLPTTLPSSLPTFPGAIPFPTSFPSSFPTMLPAWPPPLHPSSIPTAPLPPVPTAIGPGY